MELKADRPQPGRQVQLPTKNPFNGIERAKQAWRRLGEPGGIHSMELKARRRCRGLRSHSHPNPFNGIESSRAKKKPQQGYQ